VVEILTTVSPIVCQCQIMLFLHALLVFFVVEKTVRIFLERPRVLAQLESNLSGIGNRSLVYS